jgi:hypothetical protein
MTEKLWTETFGDPRWDGRGSDARGAHEPDLMGCYFIVPYFPIYRLAAALAGAGISLTGDGD